MTSSDTSRGQNQGSKPATLQGNKGLSQQKRILSSENTLYYYRKFIYCK
jgi:hypothetical protein